ncbi:hypothetical protein [Siccirubricoccus phaeus]|uniref:hypothetical protein n=1 Tax=Siccirubricoccus phaeus TaxID=2595053 RepID=UPI00165CAF88|nr:hypothetical protein [Siccirubricoccus phaeus]
MAILREKRAREEPSPRDPAAEKARWEALFAMAIKPPPGAPNLTDLLREDRDSR